MISHAIHQLRSQWVHYTLAEACLLTRKRGYNILKIETGKGCYCQQHDDFRVNIHWLDIIANMMGYLSNQCQYLNQYLILRNDSTPTVNLSPAIRGLQDKKQQVDFLEAWNMQGQGPSVIKRSFHRFRLHPHSP